MPKKTIKALREELEANQVHNIANLAGKGNPYVDYRPASDHYRVSAAWQVSRPGYTTDNDPEPYYRNHGRKTFKTDGRADFEPKRLAAIEWASNRYGYQADDWVRSPLGRNEWLPRSVFEKRLAELGISLTR